MIGRNKNIHYPCSTDAGLTSVSFVEYGTLLNVSFCFFLIMGVSFVEYGTLLNVSFCFFLIMGVFWTGLAINQSLQNIHNSIIENAN